MQCCESFMQKLCILKHWMTGITVDECSVALWHLYLTTDVLFNSFSRKKGVYTRDKSKLYLKQYCETVQGIWKVKVRLLYIKMSLILNKLNLPIIFNWFARSNSTLFPKILIVADVVYVTNWLNILGVGYKEERPEGLLILRFLCWSSSNVWFFWEQEEVSRTQRRRWKH